MKIPLNHENLHPRIKLKNPQTMNEKLFNHEYWHPWKKGI